MPTSAVRRADGLAQPRPAGSDAGVGSAPRAFAKQLVATSKQPRRRLGRRARRPPGAGRAWLRSRLGEGARYTRNPAGGNQKAWKGALALSGRTGFADRAEALADLYRFGRDRGARDRLRGVEGKLGRKRALDRGEPVDLRWRPDGHRAGRIDVRILVLISYLAERHG